MKITVITGTPRRHGNSFVLTDAFIKKAEKLDHTVQRFDVALMKIGGYHTCNSCFKTGKACSFDNDFNLIAPSHYGSRYCCIYHAESYGNGWLSYQYLALKTVIR